MYKYFIIIINYNKFYVNFIIINLVCSHYSNFLKLFFIFQKINEYTNHYYLVKKKLCFN